MIEYFNNHKFDLDDIESNITTGKKLPENVAESVKEVILKFPDYTAYMHKTVYDGDDIDTIFERSALIKIFRYDNHSNASTGLAIDPSGIFLLKGPFSSPSFYNLIHTANGEEGILDDGFKTKSYHWVNGRISASKTEFTVVDHLEIERISSPRAITFLFNEYMKNKNPWVIFYQREKNGRS